MSAVNQDGHEYYWQELPDPFLIRWYRLLGDELGLFVMHNPCIELGYN